jgi:hypothetical protein
MVEEYSGVDLLLITAITNLYVETRKEGEVVNLLIQRDSNNFLNIYSTNLKETKNFSISIIVRDILCEGMVL